MDDSESLFNIGTAVAAALVGLVVGVREFVGQPRKVRNIESRLEELEQMLSEVLESEHNQDIILNKISRVEAELADVLKHPNDSGFGTQDVLQHAGRIIDMIAEQNQTLKEIREELHSIRVEQIRLARGSEG